MTSPSKYLTFCLGDEEYGIEILKTSEIIGMTPITRVPRMPEFVLGVINLRGNVIPITDLRVKFGMPVAAARDNCIVIVQMQGVRAGIVVDRVREVAAIDPEEIEALPPFGASVRTEFLLGIVTTSDRVRLLLDIDRVLAPHELDALEALPDAA